MFVNINIKLTFFGIKIEMIIYIWHPNKGEVYCLVPTAKNEIKPIDDKKKKKKAVGLLPSNSSTNNSHEHNGSNLIKSENNPSKLLDCTDEVFLEREYP